MTPRLTKKAALLRSIYADNDMASHAQIPPWPAKKRASSWSQPTEPTGRDAWQADAAHDRAWRKVITTVVSHMKGPGALARAARSCLRPRDEPSHCERVLRRSRSLGKLHPVKCSTNAATVLTQLSDNLNGPCTAEDPRLQAKLRQAYERHAGCSPPQRRRELSTHVLEDLCALLFRDPDFAQHITVFWDLEWENESGAAYTEPSPESREDGSTFLRFNIHMRARYIDFASRRPHHNLPFLWGTLIHELLHAHVCWRICQLTDTFTEYCEEDEDPKELETWELCVCGARSHHGPLYAQCASDMARRLRLPGLDALSIFDSEGKCHTWDLGPRDPRDSSRSRPRQRLEQPGVIGGRSRRNSY